MTEFLIGGRATGKSYEAMRWLRGAGNRRLIVPDSRQADYLSILDVDYAARNGVSRTYLPEKIIPYAVSGPTRFRGQTGVELGVDNLDMLLERIFGAPVGLITATGTLRTGYVNRIEIGDQ